MKWNKNIIQITTNKREWLKKHEICMKRKYTRIEYIANIGFLLGLNLQLRNLEDYTKYIQTLIRGEKRGRDKK